MLRLIRYVIFHNWRRVSILAQSSSHYCTYTSNELHSQIQQITIRGFKSKNGERKLKKELKILHQRKKISEKWIKIKTNFEKLEYNLSYIKINKTRVQGKGRSEGTEVTAHGKLYSYDKIRLINISVVTWKLCQTEPTKLKHIA